MRSAILWETRRALAGALVLWAAQASAEGGATEREAQARFDEGVARVKAGDFEGARMSFTQAYAIVHKPTILWNLALAEEKTHRVLDALAHFKLLLRATPAGDERAGAERHASSLGAQTGHIEVDAPAGAQVLVDGALVATAPLTDTIDVLPGPHRVDVITAQGDQETDADVAGGQVVHVSQNESDEAPRASPPNPPLSPATQTPARSSSPAVEPGRAGGPSAEPGRAGGPSAPRVITAVLIGTASAVAVGLGAFFATRSQSDRNSVDSYRAAKTISYCYAPTSDRAAACSAWNDAVQAQRRDSMLSNASYVVGAGLAVGALATWLLWPKDATTGDLPSLGLLPEVGPAGGGLTAAGRF